MSRTARSPLPVERRMVVTRRFFLLLLAAGVSICGCASLDKRMGQPLSLAEIDRIDPGVHYSHILHRLGPPTAMSAVAGGMALQYEYVHIRERQYGLILPGDLGNLIKAVYASADAKVQVMQFVFDGKGNLLGSDAGEWAADAGSGFSVTLIFSAGSLTDTHLYEESVDRAMDWGRGLTLPPLVTLNVMQSVETGANGMQLSGTTTKVGQHTLELGD